MASLSGSLDRFRADSYTETVRTVCETITIHAPIERVFALSTRLELVQKTLGMKLVSGPAAGSIVAGSRVHWRGWKFGLPTSHHTLITGFASPHSEGNKREAFFQDSQERGRFAEFHHDHFFTQIEGSGETLLEDRVHFALPWFFGGGFTAQFLLAPYILKLARQRFALLKRVAESDAWRQYLPD
jgi:ligand-binding SRPBCC domain-containing protein